MTLDLGQVIVWVIIGMIAGTFAAFVFRRRGYGSIGNLLIGLLGGVIGGVLFDLLNIRIGGELVLRFTATDLLGAFVGALILLFLLRMISRR
jgi:uncharacterized membrane protein YeaQ/YmgE (transglycosylase-associated protein family)